MKKMNKLDLKIKFVKTIKLHDLNSKWYGNKTTYKIKK